jgi:hypothetical protein
MGGNEGFEVGKSPLKNEVIAVKSFQPRRWTYALARRTLSAGRVPQSVWLWRSASESTAASEMDHTVLALAGFPTPS